MISMCKMTIMVSKSLHKPWQYTLVKYELKIQIQVIIFEISIQFISLNLPNCSSILSHSSRMKCLVCFRFSNLVLDNAPILPGVPTTMCGQLVLMVASSFLMLMPPKNTPTLTAGMYLEKRSYSLAIWKANSRVWHITSTDTCWGTKGLMHRV